MGPRAKSRFWTLLVAPLVGGWMTVLSAQVSAGSDSLEYAVKAVYLYKFGNFIEWPASAFPAPASVVNLCIVGDDPFGVSLDTAVAGQRIAGRPIVVRRLTAVTRDSGCQILFVGGSDAQNVGQVLDAVRGAAILTVTDAASAGQTPSIIRFVIEDDHVRFAINDHAAAVNGITVSSKLLSLAVSVTPKE